MRYEDLPGVNWSTLSAMDRSPLHYHHLTEHPRGDTDAFRLGRCTHCAILEPQKLQDRVITWEGGQRRGKAWEMFCSAHTGKEIVAVHERDLIAGMAAAVHCHPAASSLLSGQCRIEEPVTWTDERTGIECKCRVDCIRTGDSQLVEIKTARSVNPVVFARAAATYRYHGQIAYYHDGARCEGTPMIIAVESTPPHDVVVFASSSALEPGRALYRDLLRRLAECRASGEWPGYSAEPVNLDLPDWAYEHTDGEDAMAWFREGA